MRSLDELMLHAGQWKPEDMEELLQVVGKSDPDMDSSSDDFWEDSVLKDYARYVYNYMYTYKDAARKVDPSIDPEQQQTGPMAQDLEHVNPACIVETPEGVKTVDTRKLALMNAGAIADLARKLEEMQKQLDMLKGED